MAKINNELQNQDDYRTIRNMLGALAEKTIWRHKTLCEGEESVTIDAIANVFVQEHGDELMLDIIDKLTKIYQRYTQRYQLIVRVNGDPYQTAIFTYFNIEECIDVARNYVELYPGNHHFTIVDTNLETRKVYDDGEVRKMITDKVPELKAYRVELTYNLHRDIRVIAENMDAALDMAREIPITPDEQNIQEVDSYVEEVE